MAAELNFSRAAQRIHVVQSALSAPVGRLEKELGVELFDRTTRQIALTLWIASAASQNANSAAIALVGTLVRHVD